MKALGAPAWWHSSGDGTSTLVYNYVRNTEAILRRIERATFDFDEMGVLTQARFPPE